MRFLTAFISLLVLAMPTQAAAAAPRALTVAVVGTPVVGQPLRLVVEADGADGVRLSLPDLQGGLTETVCRAAGPAPGRSRFTLLYTPEWAGTHVLTVTVVGGACDVAPATASRPVQIEVGPAPAPGMTPVAPTSGRPETSCRGADARPAFTSARILRAAVRCLVDAARADRGLPRLRSSGRLRAAASRQLREMTRRRAFGHFSRLADTRAELATMATGPMATPRAVVTAWLGSDAHRPRLLDPRARTFGLGVLRAVAAPPERPGATYVIDLG